MMTRQLMEIYREAKLILRIQGSKINIIDKLRGENEREFIETP